MRERALSSLVPRREGVLAHLHVGPGVSLGPTIATGLNAATLRVKTTLNGQVRQDYPISDMRFSVARLVSSISHDMTLCPGDVILCGTSVGVGSMKPGSTVEVEIDGIGTLSNSFV